MKKLTKTTNKISWYKKLLILSGILIALGNPLSLALIADVTNIGLKQLTLLVDKGFTFIVAQSLYFVIAGAVGLLIGSSVWLGVREATKVSKMKTKDRAPRNERKAKTSFKAGELIESK